MSETQVAYGYLPIQLNPERPLGAAILNEWRQELERGWFTLGPGVERLETAWAEACGMKHAIGVNSGTDALIIGLKALGVGPGDKVVTCPNTFVATVGAIVAVGATPMFVDAGPDYLIDMEAVAREMSYTPFKVIIPVDLTGRPVVHRFRELAASVVRPFILRDACQSIGATYNGSPSARMSDITAYSLHPLKNVHGCGDGGMVVTDDGKLAERARWLANFCSDKERRYVHEEIGFKYPLTNVQAAIGFAQLERIEEIIKRKREIATKYNKLLNGIPGLTLPAELPNVRNVYWMYGILIGKEFGMSRDKVKEKLKEKGIDTRFFFTGMHKQPSLQQFPSCRNFYPVSEKLEKCGLYLPCGMKITNEQQEYVASTIRELQNREL